MSRTARLLLRPPSLPLIGLFAIGALVTFVAAVPPGGDSRLVALSILCWLIAGGAWIARFVSYAAILAELNLTSPPDGYRWRRWLAPPGLFLTTILLVLARVPAWAGFAVSYRSMERFAVEAQTLPPGTRVPDRTLGLYTATGIERTQRGLRFTVKNHDSGGEGGFAYFPDPSAALNSEDGPYEHWCGRWYGWYHEW